MTRRILYSLLSFFAVFFATAQNYNMTNGQTIYTCAGTFYDSGGPTANYGNTQTMTYTICPPANSDSSIMILFTEFDLEQNADYLYVYDGADITAPLIETFTGTEIPLAFQATGNNTSGCLTFRFVSDTYNNRPGWAATISCQQQCQTISAQLANSVPTATNNIIRACKGQSISLTGTGVFEEYSDNATYHWDLGDGTTVVGETINHIYANPGVYRVSLRVYDEFGCFSTNSIGLNVQVSPDPTFTVDPTPEYICFGEDHTFTITPSYEFIQYICNPPVNELTFLPDTNDPTLVYRAYITVDCFAQGQTLQSVNDFLSVCVNMEHSYLGDLSMRLISPSGQTISLKNYSGVGGGGNGTYLGHPWDGANDVGLGPGIGEQYCFTPQATVYLVDGATQPALNTAGNSKVPGDYMPSQPLTGLVGSLLNGVWTLEVQDHLSSDNGYIFGWNVNFSDNIVPADLSFQPEVVNIQWVANDEIVTSNQGTVTVRPQNGGTRCYTALVTNNMGCTYEQEFCVEVTDEIEVGEPRDLEDCIDPAGIAEFDLNEVLVDISTDPILAFSFHNTEEDARENENAIATTQTLTMLDGPKIIWVRIHNTATECNVFRSFVITPKDCSLFLNPVSDMSICEGDANSFDLTVYDTTVYNNNLDYNVTYHYNENDALFNLNAIPDALTSNFVATNGQEIFIRVTKNDDVEVFEITSFKLWIHPKPQVFALPTVVSCEMAGAGLAQFDLSSVIQIANGGAASLEVSFYTSQAFAELGYVDLQLPLDYTGPAGTIYVRVYNPNTGCYIVSPLTLQIVPQPQAVQIAPLVLCDLFNDGREIFNLEPTAILIAGNPLPQGVLVTYHETMADAQLNQNAIQNINTYQNITLYNQTLYVRVGYNNSECATIVPLQLQVTPTPQVVDPTPLVVCDLGNNSVENFNLTTKISEVLNGLNPANYTVTFHLTEANAASGTNAITNPSVFSNQTANQVFIRVTDNATGCYKYVKLSLQTKPVPVAPTVLPTYSICDTNNDGFGIFNLQSQISQIVGNQVGVQVTFHYTAADAQSGNAPLPNNYQNVVPNVQTIHVRLFNPTTGCYSVTTMDIRVSPNPLVNVPTTPYVICNLAGTGGFGTIDLTGYGNALVAGTGFTITYFETQANAQANVLPIGSPFAYNNLQQSNPVVWIRVVNPDTTCFSVYPIYFQLIAAPSMPLTLPELSVCDTFGNNYDGIAIFDLTVQNDLILAENSGDLSGFVIRYYTSEADALAGVNFIGNPTEYQNLANPQTIWVSVENVSNPGGCKRVRSFTISVNSSIFLTQPAPISICESSLPNNGSEVVNLTIRELQILGGVQTFGAVFQYFETQQNMENGVGAIANPTAYTTQSANQTIYVKVTNQFGCVSTTILQIRVLPLPEVEMNPAPLQICEDQAGSGMGTFDLSDSEFEIGNEANNLNFEYYTNYDGAVLADAGSLIGTPLDYFTSSGTVYVRVTNITTNPADACAVIVPLQLIVNPSPAVGPMTPLFVCLDNNTGFYTFNLNDKTPEALAGQNPALYDVKYFIDEDTAEAGTNPIPFIYTNVIQGGQTIWVRVEHKESKCYSIASFRLSVEEKVYAFPPSNTTFCEIDFINDGTTPVDLTVMDAEIISVQNATPLAVRYYRANGALIPDPTNYVATNGEVITAEVFINVQGSLCTASVSFTIFTKEGPEIKEIPNGVVCYNLRDGSLLQGHFMDTGLPTNSDYVYLWTRNGEVVSTTSTHTAIVAGTYVVTVTYVPTGCSNTRTIVVTEAPAITIDEIKYSEAFEETTAIEVIAFAGTGVALEYSLDEGPWQDSNIFENVTPGEHTVRVQIKDSADYCPAVEIIQVMSHPPFFTPNGDGYNDTWNISSLKYQPEAKIHIFDRYGKLIKTISPSGPGWDGKFNGNDMPATDYWFKATYVDPKTGLEKEATGHFSLKR